MVVIDRDGKTRKAKILQVMGHEGLDRVEVPEAQAGSIVCITGVDKLNISDTICHPEEVAALPALSVDEPTDYRFKANSIFASIIFKLSLLSFKSNRIFSLCIWKK